MSIAMRAPFFILLGSGLLLGLSSSAARRDSPAQLADADPIELVRWREAKGPFSILSDDAANLAHSSIVAGNQSKTAGPKFDPKLIKSIRENTDFLQQRWAADVQHGGIPKDYLAGLQLDAERLRGVVAAATVTEKTNGILQDVADDLQIKASHCKSSSKGWASLISVDINTLKRDGSVVKGLEVWYVLKGWAGVSDRWTRCRKVSSPASAGKLSPGKYVMRIADGEPRVVQIGGDGKDTQSIDLLVS
jgi:hypothetical protein